MSAHRGKIYLVGLGPGDVQYLVPAGSDILASSDVVVGYRAYIEQISSLIHGKEIVSMELGQELERAAVAVDLAYDGQSVAVVSSGDAGIYGMAAPVFQVLSTRDWDGRAPEVETVPGVSAMQAAASILGAPLMQDFCAISLSDLLTPWEKIRTRLEAAARGDFVIALYNPRSRTRQMHLLEAREIMLKHLGGDTPVGIVADAYRDGQRVTVTDLEHLSDLAHTVDMVTMVIVGNSTSYTQSGRMVTPRGYDGDV